MDNDNDEMVSRQCSYKDDARNIVDENYGMFSLIQMH